MSKIGSKGLDDLEVELYCYVNCNEQIELLVGPNIIIVDHRTNIDLQSHSNIF